MTAPVVRGTVVRGTEVRGSDQPGSARKRELLDAAYRYALSSGLADMSLRPLAKAIESSPRVLLFLFGSKEGLIRALLARAREDELSYLAALRKVPADAGLAATGAQVWSWLAAPEHRALLGLWVEGYALSLRGDPGPWAGFAADTVSDWLDLLAARQPASHGSTPAGRDERTLLLAVLRGALLDLLATGDTDRVTRAVESHLQSLTAGWQASNLDGDAAGTRSRWEMRMDNGAIAEDVVNRFGAAWGAHDLAATLALISDDCVFESTAPPDGQRYVGRTEIAAAWKPIFDDTASRFTVEHSFAAGEQVVQQWRYDWDGGHVRGVDLFTVRDGLVTAKIAYVKG